MAAALLRSIVHDQLDIAHGTDPAYRLDYTDRQPIAVAPARRSALITASCALLHPGTGELTTWRSTTRRASFALRIRPPSQRPLSPIDIDGADLRGVEVRREWSNIDLLVTCRQPPFVVAVENKVGSGEHSNQLTRYRNTITEHFPDARPLYVWRWFRTTVGTCGSRISATSTEGRS